MSKIPEVLRPVWLAQRDRVFERVDEIERALVALEDGALDEPALVEAQRAAHMLAGSVGTFGFMRASVAAAELDRSFDDLSSEVGANLIGLLTTLRRDLRDDG